MDDQLYSFVMRGELTKVSLRNTGITSQHESSKAIEKKYIESLSLDLLDSDVIESSKLMATVYIAIATFEKTVRSFIEKIMLENIGEDWWNTSVSEKIKSRAESRKAEEEKIKWHSLRGESYINYTEFGDLASIMNQNYQYFEDYIISIDWARQIFQTLERSRNVIMHSGELGLRDVERIGTNIRDWISQIGA